MRVIRKLSSLLAVLLLAGILPCLLALADDQGEAFYITELQAYGWRVKLRDRPSQSGDILGQYYAGTEMMVYSMSDGWAQVDIGGQKGYMMSEFLAPVSDGKWHSPSIGLVRFTDGDGCIGLWDRNGSEIMRVPRGPVTVLGTVDDLTLHIAAESGGMPVYGYASSEKITEADNMATAVTDTGSADGLANVRGEPSKDAEVKAQLYSGVRVYRLYDDHTSGDGWEKVRVGGLAGYIMNEFLDYSSAGVQRYQPPAAELAVPSAIVTGCATRGSISRGDPLWVLGISGSERMPLYYCLTGSPTPEGPDEYVYDTCYIRQDMVKTRLSGSASTLAALTAETPLYWQDAKGGLYPSELIVNDNAAGTVSGTITTLPTGTKVSVYYGTSKPGEMPDFNGYVMPGSKWLYVEAEYAPYQSAGGFIPIGCAAYDTGLAIPEEWMVR